MGSEKIKVEKNIHSKPANKWICSRWIDRQQKDRKVEGYKEIKRWKNANGKKMKTRDIKRNCGRYKIEIKT